MGIVQEGPKYGQGPTHSLASRVPCGREDRFRPSVATPTRYVIRVEASVQFGIAVPPPLRAAPIKEGTKYRPVPAVYLGGMLVGSVRV